ncbi:MAG: NIPSNAP family protein [Caulobacter sp.]
MLVEMRTYTVAPGATARYLKAYAEKGLAVQTRILGCLVGYYTVEIGPLNRVVHLWGYDSLNERARRRAILWKDPEWRSYVKEIAGLVQTQETCILSPAPFLEVSPARVVAAPAT